MRKISDLMKDKTNPQTDEDIPDTSFLERKVIVDSFTDEPLSSLIKNIRELFRGYGTELEITTIEKGGVVESVDIRARIQIKR